MTTSITSSTININTEMNVDTDEHGEHGEHGSVHTQSIRHPVSHYIFEPKNATVDTAKRIIAMVFTYDKKTGTIHYGASIFKRDYDKEICKKRNNRHTAEERFKLEPVIINIEPSEDITIPDVTKAIRHAMTTGHGVRGKRNKSESIVSATKEETETGLSVLRKFTDSTTESTEAIRLI